MTEAWPDPHLAQILDVVSRSSVPVLVLEVPSELILATSPAAQMLLTGDGQPVVGRSLEDFTVDPPTDALKLLASGQLYGYEARRTLRRSGAPLRIWVHAIDSGAPPRLTVAMLGEGDDARPPRLPARAAKGQSAVIGATDQNLLIDRVSSDIEAFVGRPPDRVIGTSLLNLVDPADVGRVLWGLAQVSLSATDVSVRVRLNHGDGRQILCQLVLVGLVPPPSCGFALLPADDPLDSPATGSDLERLLWRLGRGFDVADASQELAGTRTDDIRGLAGALSSRELEIVARLLAGDRVPVIAKRLFISQSTVRNHLSSVFRKLGVDSQQQLIDLLRHPGDAPPGPTL
jgi:DNA-binding CsgD family transcriptional regulator